MMIYQFITGHPLEALWNFIWCFIGVFILTSMVLAVISVFYHEPSQRQVIRKQRRPKVQEPPVPPEWWMPH
jgi:hypothetical protein